MNTLLIENYTVTTPASNGYNHDKNGTAAFMINGKTKLLGTKDTAIPSNYNRANTAYALKPAGSDSNLGN